MPKILLPPHKEQEWCKGCYIYDDRAEIGQTLGGKWDFTTCYNACWLRLEDTRRSNRLTHTRKHINLEVL
jgi:hypothetical protein